MHFKTGGKTEKQRVSIDTTAKVVIERLIREGRLFPNTAGAAEAVSVQTMLAELSSRGDTVSQSAAILIRGLAEIHAQAQSELTEWREIQEHCISDTTDPTTKTRIIVAILPHSVLVM